MDLRQSALVLALALLVGCQGPIPAGEGRVSGLVGARPAAPQGNDVAPSAGKTVEFGPTGGGETRSTTTGSDGRYVIDLSPGEYEVRLLGFVPIALYYARTSATYGQWPRVAVVAGRQTNLDLIYDSGIR